MLIIKDIYDGQYLLNKTTALGTYKTESLISRVHQHMQADTPLHTRMHVLMRAHCYMVRDFTHLTSLHTLVPSLHQLCTQ